jgi:hypothetical protein
MTDTVNVRLPRRIRKVVDKRYWPIAVSDETTLEEVLRHLAHECHPDFGDLLTGNLHGSLRLECIILNGRTIALPEDLKLPVRGGDRLAFIAVLGGG